MSSEIAYGIHSISAIMANEPERLIEVYALKDRKDDRMAPLISQAHSLGVSVQYMSRKVLDDKSDGEQHQGIIARVKAAKQKDEADLSDLLARLNQQNIAPLLLILDGVTDPHNLGAVLRTADAAGVHGVIVPKDRSAKLTGTARKVACGAAEVMPLFVVTNLARSLKSLQNEGVWIVGTAGEAEQDVFQKSMTGPLALVMGAEGTGMRRLTRENCDDLVKIPMAGSVSSLNVSVATGVILFEAVRQRTLA
ncbi:23S rRNA (guanosine(2251)-2'-O)-methyltransferase RlmB [Psychrosphaera sp. B3R10]|uniref:23S rRNA (guanosine-2'-O-)-methyltransferase RlmB n=1 Tax=Psychrosphaera algicola TaxID=3023714 RepID=A0ABT5FDG8_9GAMM|nr:MULTISPECIES: 23S rRNA (guanosine(2251)-2'-O)-methyltransferase RlmB [unclassified Psychrosphaera]MBU2882674.1 23S rRNA (guanosine(2251)-2'-O)-methyltransferase RlmB [Psychrosphaera sp. I2R16]MBU2989307.1 23S rRNA (guanosine(2251)-2'-O)-methyltransferase RlmB [Psychrosphaera sp. B3R10]MDC2889557.1 23S rRNA (guanosine(2251)-2'-O)-methyltransferase RlmB [Psychrosphaera sp. G1-22]